MPIDHIVKESETTSSLAAEYGFSPHTIWDHPANAELKKKREHMNILMPGDVIKIPDKKLKEVTRETEQQHRFVLNNTPARFKLQIYFADGEPRANQAYELHIDDKEYTGKTDGHGVLNAFISPKAKTGTLVLLPGQETITLHFGRLNPINEDSGIRHRLTNLGFDCGKTEEELKAALMLFQKDCELEETGELDDPTRKKLEELHDTVCDYPTEETDEAEGGET